MSDSIRDEVRRGWSSSDLTEPLDRTDHRYHTVAGFALDRMRRLPRIGESFNHGLWRFEIIDIDGTRIDKILAAPQPTLHRTV